MRATDLSSPTLARWLAGPLVWTAHFFIIYGSESLVCSRGGGAAMHLMLVAAATVIGLAILLVLTLRSWRASSREDAGGQAAMDQIAAGLGLLGILGLIWTAVPAALLSACLPPA